MVKNVYLVVECLTPRCGQVCLIKYLGRFQEGKPIDELVPATGFYCECQTCGKTHRYTRDDVYPLKSDDPPPPGFKDRF